MIVCLCRNIAESEAVEAFSGQTAGLLHQRWHQYAPDQLWSEEGARHLHIQTGARRPGRNDRLALCQRRGHGGQRH